MEKFIIKASSFTPNIRKKQAEALRKEFVARFDKNKLERITLEEYALGQNKNNRDSFCYWLETKLNAIGNIHGSTSQKFGVYFGRTKSDPELKWRWTSWTNGDFNIVRKALVNLYEAGDKDDTKAIKDNFLSPMFKGKILSVYFPQKYLNIFADYHLKYFLDKLNIRYAGVSDPIDLRQLLMAFKNSHFVFKQWSAIDFGHYLYEFFGTPSLEDIYDEKKATEEWYDSEQRQKINRAITGNKESRRYADIPLVKPETIETKAGKVYNRNNDKAVQALADADFSCEIDKGHESFLRKNSRHKYTEAHHLIPMSAQDDFENTLDTPANIISLCSNCHNWIHYGSNAERLLKQLYEQRKSRLKMVGISISFDNLKQYYK